MKPSWDTAPKWAKWLAQDQDGTWFWFDKKPIDEKSFGEWYPPLGGKCEKNIDANDNWDITLEHKPSKGERK